MPRGSRSSCLTAILLAFLWSYLPAPPAGAQEDDWGEERPCEGVLAEVDQMVEVLGQVPKYQSTYVLVFRDEHADEVLALDAPGLLDLRVAVHAESPAATMPGAGALAGLESYAFDPADAGRIVGDILAGDVDVGLLWAPLAGLAALELDFDYELSFRTAGEPLPPPAAFAGVAAAAALPACADEIQNQLGGYGVVPAEKLVKVDIRDLLHLPAPPRDAAGARQGAALYAEHCAKCHGDDAVAATDALAPVDLLISTPRFSYPGFLYIVWNGRSRNGMPGFRGTLSQEQVALVYQFARELSHGATDLSADDRTPRQGDE